MSERPETMGAVVCHGPRDYRLETVAVPEPGPGEALVRVEAVGVCASDLKCFHGTPETWATGTRPRCVEPGVVPGHECISEIVELGDDAALPVGVTISGPASSPGRRGSVPCGACPRSAVTAPTGCASSRRSPAARRRVDGPAGM